MDDSLAIVAAVAAVVASGVGGLFALGGVIVQERLAARRLERENAAREKREARLRRLERRLESIRDTKSATDDIYDLISSWSFGNDAEQLRQVREAARPARNPRADWEYVDDDAAMIEMHDVTRDILARGRGAGDLELDVAALLVAYNRVASAVMRQEDRLQDGVEELPLLGQDGQDAFMRWISLVEQIRLSR